MAQDTAKIRPLPAAVAAQIHSSVVIPSLSYGILGLVSNSLDARATKITISVDFGRGACSVEDDGCGITPKDFAADGGLGKRYRKSDRSTRSLFLTQLPDTSKSTAEYCEGYGTFLSSLAALSILTITSHHYANSSTNTLLLHHSRAAARLTPAPPHQHLDCRNHGTRVQVQDLFGNMPVRIKQRPIRDEDRKARDREWEWLRRNVTGTILAWDRPVSLNIQGSDKDQKLHFKGLALGPELLRSSSEQPARSKAFDLEFIRSTLQQGAGIDPLSWRTWVKTSARTPYMTIRATISLEPAPSKETQFICLGNQYIGSDSGCNILYEEVNHLFALSRYGIQEDDALHKKAKAEKQNDKRFKVDGFTNNELRAAGKGVDRWPRFFIRIELHDGNPILLKQDRILADQRKTLSSITGVLEAMINGFLAEHHLRPRKARSGKRNVHSNSTLKPQTKKIVRFSEPSPSSAVANRMSKRGTSQEGKPEPNRLGPSDLGGNVNLPKFTHSKSSDSCMADGFSGWSRIKGLSKKDRAATAPAGCLPRLLVSELPKAVAENIQSAPMIADCIPPSESPKGELSELLHHNPTTCVDELETDPTDTDPPRSCKNVHDHSSTHLRGSKSLHEGEEQVSDALITWTDPITKATVQINARTGSVLEERLQPSSGMSGNTNLAHQRVRNSKLRHLGSLRSTSGPVLAPKEGSWAANLLETWENPVFRRTEEAIPTLSIDGPSIDDGGARNPRFPQIDLEGAFKDASDSCAVSLSKQGLQNATVVAQVDKKFILIQMAMSSPAKGMGGLDDIDDYVLVLVDQHAADERIRIEALLADLCTKTTDNTNQISTHLGLRSSIETTRLAKPVTLEISPREYTLFEKNATYFANWGILYDLTPSHQSLSELEDLRNSKLVVLTLPDSIAERCRIDVKQLANLLRGEVWKREESGVNQAKQIDLAPADNSNPSISSPIESTNVSETWAHRIRDCPQGIIDMLNSRSCRSAVMFNDDLADEDCRTLVKKLATCSFPFQCAHGRPSMIPLIKVDSANGLNYGSIGKWRFRCNARKEVDFRKAWKESVGF